MKYIEETIKECGALSCAKNDLEAAVRLIVNCYENSGKVLTCGNGGSAADSEHIVGELLKGFMKKRPLDKAASFDKDIAGRLQKGLPAISLVSQSAIITAVINDLGADLIFAQQVCGLARPGDIIIGLSTSGNADNIVKAFKTAKAFGMKCIAMTGEQDSKLSELSDVAVKAPATDTPRVQEYHLKLYHALCAEVEEYFFKD